MNALSVRGLSKEYESFRLKNVSFDVAPGQIMGFIGRNGAGKTTTLKCLLNLIHPDGGEALFFGRRFSEAELEIKRRIGFVSGGVDYYNKKKLDAITSVTRRFYPDRDDAACKRYMSMFALDGRKTPDQLSAGMRVKYALTLALSHRAELLILDEPTSGLDPVSRDDLLDVFLSLQREGVSILFSTHITSDLDKCADAITYIKNGEIVASEDLRAFVGKYRALHLSEAELTDELRPCLIGLKPAKTGYTALIHAGDAQRLGVPGEQADLETAMIHMEKE